MNDTLRFRKLQAEEIDCRIQSIKQNGVSLLLYKDARVDQNILDETLGVFGWKRSHQLIGDRLYCTVSVWDYAKNQWIDKQDVGKESKTETEKGQASDSFKRACFNFGIGRELYTAPFIWIPSNLCKIENGKCYDKFEVTRINYLEGNISELEIYNASLKCIAFSFGKSPVITAKQVATLKNLCVNHKLPEEKIFKLYQKNKLEELTLDDWESWKHEGKELIEKWDKESESQGTN